MKAMGESLAVHWLMYDRRVLMEVLLLAGILSMPLSAEWKVARIHVTTGQIFFALVLLAWAAACGVQNVLKSMRPAGPLNYLEWSMVAFLGACAVSGVAATAMTLWLKELLQVGFCMLIYVFVRSNALRVVSLEQYCGFITAVAAGAALAGIGQYFMSPDETIVMGRTRPYLTFGDPNNFAAVLAGMVPLALGAACQSRRRWAYVAGSGVVAACLISTLSRSAWLGAMVGLTLVVFLQFRRVLLPGAVFVLLLVVEIAVLGYDIRMQETDARPAIAVMRRDTDSTIRVALMRLGLAMLREHPLLGVGLGNSGAVMPEYFARVNVGERFLGDYRSKGLEMTIHSTPLQVLVELGMFGGVTGVAVVVALVFMFRQCYKRSDPHDKALVAGLIGACAAILVTTSAGWLFTRGVVEIFFILIGLAAAHRYRQTLTGSEEKTADAAARGV